MKKWIWAAAAVLLAWCIYLTYSLNSLKQTAASSADNAVPSGTAGSVIVNNTVNGYTTDITKTAAAAQSKIVTVTAYSNGEVLRSMSGVVYSSDSSETDILTNAKVLADADTVTVRFDNSVELQAGIAGSDDDTDLALLKTNPSFDVTPITFTDSDSVQEGEYVIAIGGRRADSGAGTVSFGVVSSSGHLLRESAEAGSSWIVSVMESDVSINQSNTGGPIVNLSGELVGVLSSSLSSAAGNSGMAYAVSANEAKKVAEQLKSTGTVTRGYLGVSGTNVSEMETYQKNALNIMLDQTTGVYIEQVQENSPASISGIAVGDIITEIDDVPVEDEKVLMSVLYSHIPGDLVNVTLIRGGTSQSVSVTLE
ncbi:MAG: S1C family serine protease [Solobacterium sp.]|jgi:serine protease Do|nr:S1C family serine protease [Solobacterium sp.]MCH4222060.1 S1C family serine protease [Solobacterium sp.]MCH4265722.1 S1C family serine protease [Solobacterium sp.]